MIIWKIFDASFHTFEHLYVSICILISLGVRYKNILIFFIINDNLGTIRFIGEISNDFIVNTGYTNIILPLASLSWD